MEIDKELQQTESNGNSTIVETVNGDKTDTVKKDEFCDREAIQEAVQESALNPTATRVPPSFLVEENQIVRIDVDVLSDPQTGKILAVFKSGLYPDEEGPEDGNKTSVDDFVVKTKQWFDFSIPNYEEISMYRQQSSRYVNKETVIDINTFRNFILIGHLRDWSLTDKNGQKIMFERDLEDRISKDGFKVVNRIPVIIWDVVLTLFEKETLIM